ncbi:MAG: PAS domain-containing sensor histidine kinase [Bdellovibrionaceae bacterium]|nr:PAS domain-containing sensor histidine kinase [Pseudobdellovibrionaceae bacterium]
MAMLSEKTILWVGEKPPAEPSREWPSDVKLVFHSISDQDDPLPSADLVVIRWAGLESLQFLKKWRLRWPDVPLVLSAKVFDEESLRTGINQFAVKKFLTDQSWEVDLLDVLQETGRLGESRRERDLVLREYARRNRELEKLNEALEKTVTERTVFLEESTHEEKDKLSKERQLIRFLTEISLQISNEDILRVLRRELRRYHKIQNPVMALHEPGHRAEFMSFRGDQVLRQEGPDQWPPAGAGDRELRQFFANHFGRPFNRALFYKLDLHSAGEGILAVEYSLMEENEVHLISDLLQERVRALAMAVERLFLEDRLRRFAIRWERTFDGFREPVAVIDTSMNVLRGNRAFAPRMASGRACHQVFAGRDLPCEGCPVIENPESKETLYGNIRVGRRVYRVSSWPVQEAGAKGIAGRVTHYSDITESREIYLRMLQNEKMSAIGSLAGHIAHELNNPLTGIRSLAQVLMQDPASHEGTLHEDLKQIENAARRCQKIIRHLLEFTRGGGGQAVPISVDDVVESTLPLLKTALRPHRLEMLLGTRNVKITAEPHLLQQVVFNLVNNSCQAMKTAGHIGIISRVNRGFVELKLSDSGPGIPLEIQSRLFEPFFTTKPEGEGTGLGLSTSRVIIEKYGGSIEFRSEIGKGTEFTLRFPLKEKP